MPLNVQNAPDCETLQAGGADRSRSRIAPRPLSGDEITHPRQPGKGRGESGGAPAPLLCFYVTMLRTASLFRVRSRGPLPA